MKITLNIEVSNADELNQIADALKTVKSTPTVSSAEVTHKLDAEIVEGEETVKEAKPKKGKAAKAPKVSKAKEVEAPEAEEYEEVESPFAEGPLVSEEPKEISPGVPPVIEAAKVEAAPTPKAEPAPAPQAQNVANNAQVVEYIKTQAQRLGHAPGLSKEQKHGVINSLLVEINAPQGVKASELPEPYLSAFANRIAGKIDAALGGNAALV